MHIKAFLKKISQIPSVDITNPYKTTLNRNSTPQRNIKSNIGHYSESTLLQGGQNQSNTITYLNNHHPFIKTRLIRQIQVTTSPQKIAKTKFRQKIQERLMDLMNQRKDLVVTHSRHRRQSSSSLNYNANRRRSILTNNKNMPAYVQNIMKPCKVSSIVMGERPKTGRIQPSKSEPKLYCKPLIAPRQRVMRMSTADCSEMNRRSCKSKEEVYQEKKMKLIAEGKVDGWNKSKQNGEDEYIWLR